MKRVVVGSMGLGLLMAVGLLLSGAAHPEPEAHNKGCSRRTLKGTYVFAYSGVQIVDGQPVPFVFAGQDRINGDGTLTGVNSFSINGVISRNVSYTGLYTVNPDCTGSSTTVDDGTGETAHFDLFFGRDGDAISFVQTDAGFVTAAIEQRVRRTNSH